MDIDYEFWKFWIAVLNFFGTVVLAAYIFVTSRSRVNTSSIKSIETEFLAKHSDIVQKHDEIKDRVIRMEERLPKDQKEDLVLIHNRLNKLSDEQHTLSGEFKQTSEAVKRIHDYLITKGH
ncbi:MAG: hypothetical protein COW76_20460 [Shewanella sp. CG18_big_fil_WC_8_21_14_2_50_42_11]|uniref:hypothetical protein n=1 Tax=Shewanella sp. CG18_big_fil_WC_8_21_14_2_50_42_11 TaxID=1975538 RepID=UPI000C4A308E|nr:hypothetical protein [Shewanella sp. CG18_big_fil_WC_8_21_14_2_50_42_11]PIP98537.1 MAG: hypothetical protein COW76_20460 [Shewanella sp. CG18_big_fil_WC_8_21_14_2_50_42_11]